MSQRSCDKCGRVLGAASRFCAGCGATVEAVPSKPEAPAAVPVSSPQVVRVSGSPAGPGRRQVAVVALVVAGVAALSGAGFWAYKWSKSRTSVAASVAEVSKPVPAVAVAPAPVLKPIATEPPVVPKPSPARTPVVIPRPVLEPARVRLTEMVPVPPPPVADPASPNAIRIGQTPAQVVAVMGPPVKIASLGAKETYFYKDLKVTFVNGRMTDAQ